MNSKPLVWILYPDTPNGERTELTIYREQWSELSWWIRWWTRCFFWWQRKYIHDIPFSCSSVSVQREQIMELQRLLGGDIQCKGVRMSPEKIADAIHSLAPKSRLHLMTLHSIPSKMEEQQLANLQSKIRNLGHTIQSVTHPAQRAEWALIMATIIRYNWIKAEQFEEIRQVVFLIDRTIEDWSEIAPNMEQSALLLCNRLQTQLPNCEIHILHNSPSSKGLLHSLCNQATVWYAFLNDVCSSDRSIHPKLEDLPNLRRLQGFDTHPEWMRFLLEQIWDQTGTRA